MSTRQIDRLVAEKVMGYTVYHYDKDHKDYSFFQLWDRHGDPVEFMGGECKTEDRAWEDMPRFSEEISAAWKVVEEIGGLDLIKVDEGWMVGDMSNGYSDDDGRVDGWMKHFVVRESAPLAICLAALKFRHVEVPAEFLR